LGTVILFWLQVADMAVLLAKIFPEIGKLNWQQSVQYNLLLKDTVNKSQLYQQNHA